jgi:integrase
VAKDSLGKADRQSAQGGEDATLSPAVVKNTMQVAFAAFKWGLGHEMVMRNPFSGVARPAGRKELPDPFTAAELGLVLDNLDERWRLPCQFMAYTGLRIGELLALQWENVDWVAKTVLIARNWTGKKFEPCKTGSSRRTIEIPDHLVHPLKVWKLKCPAGELMFPSLTGHIDNEANFNNRGLTPACRRAGVRRRTPHQLRHTYATLQLAAGENLAVVSRQLGHANPTITLNIYRHVLPNEGKGLNNRMAERVREARNANGDDSVTVDTNPTSSVGSSRLSS